MHRYPDLFHAVSVSALALVPVALSGCSDPNPSQDALSSTDAPSTSTFTSGAGGSSALTTGGTETSGPGTISSDGSTSTTTTQGTSTSTTTTTNSTGIGGATSSTGDASSMGGMSSTVGPSTSSDTSDGVGGASTAGDTTATSVGGAGDTTDGAGGASTVSTSEGSGGTGGTGNVGDDICPPGIVQTISVGASGADFSSVQAAVNSIANGSSTPTRIDIRAGTYTEKLDISGRSHLCLVGEDTATTILSYDDSNSKVGSTSGSASVLIDADDFSAANLTIRNSFGSGSQAVALRVTGERQQFYNCRFVGYQDTLYTHQGSQYFRDCYVQGNTDYVFGHATAVLENCEVRNVEGGSAVSAPNTELSQAYGIVFLGGRFTAESSVSQGSVAMARPWGADGAAAFLNVELGSHISAAGFTDMSGNQPENARFREYQSTGPGAAASQHSSYQMSSGEAGNYTLSNIFPSWVPSYSQL